MKELIVIGGGLAGSEAAWQAVKRGIHVSLFEMRPTLNTPAHKTDYLSELVCSNSLGIKNPDRPGGLLKKELALMDSLILDCAEKHALPAGSSLSVDRDQFASEVTRRIHENENIKVIRQEVTVLPKTTTIVASGPLTSKLLTQQIQELTGTDQLFFYDAIAPVIEKEGIDFSIAFYGSRFGIGENDKGDYINCPFQKNEYELFVKALSTAKRIHIQDFDILPKSYFEACLPIEVIAERSMDALSFGPLRPVGIDSPGSSHKPYAVVQLRQDNLADSLYNLVGFQTNLNFSEQERIIQMIPGLKHVKIVQFGQMHRNTYICSPKLLKETLQTKNNDALFFAGQINGMEGYISSVAGGLVAGINAARILKGEPPIIFPFTTMIGALCHYICRSDPIEFHPIKSNFGLVPDLPNPYQTKEQRSHEKSIRAINDLKNFIQEAGV
jgi:methylenetetrahydrofolate--tRNA-(uracil-5-)-methyltransferase